jgi:large subunit ribosomal protein L21
MYAVVEIAGKQFRVSPNDTIKVPTLKQKPGAKIKFDRVLLIGKENETIVGNPLVAGANVEGTVVDHGRAEKVIVFKKKKRKGYRVSRGHRQGFSQVQITSIA